MIYRYLLRPLLFLMDPERVHHLVFSLLRLLFAIPGAGPIVGWFLRPPRHEVRAFGLVFRNPVGLAAGFDKDALLADKWKYLGFGFVEVGTVTPRPQKGNPKKRLFRLPPDQALINRMGFNNAGLDAMVRRLAKVKRNGLLIGANIGKNKDTPNEQAADDYVICFQKLFDYVDYFVVNVSSPNTPGLRSLQEKEPLTRLLLRLQEVNQAYEHPKPLLLKIAPDLSEEQLDDILEVALQCQLDGLIATNTTINRAGLKTSTEKIQEIGSGGLSGRPLQSHAHEVLNYLHQKSEGKISLIGVGGIMSAADATARMEAGAVLVQLYTGFVYGGPGMVKKLVKGIKPGIARQQHIGRE